MKKLSLLGLVFIAFNLRIQASENSDLPLLAAGLRVEKWREYFTLPANALVKVETGVDLIYKGARYNVFSLTSLIQEKGIKKVIELLNIGDVRIIHPWSLLYYNVHQVMDMPTTSINNYAAILLGGALIGSTALFIAGYPLLCKYKKQKSILMLPVVLVVLGGSLVGSFAGIAVAHKIYRHFNG